MSVFPSDLSVAIAQARTATAAALGDGLNRVQVEFALPELKVMPVVAEFLSLFDPWRQSSDPGAAPAVRIFFPDAGAAALAQRDWGTLDGCAISDIGSGRTPALGKIAPEDQIFLFIEASAVEVNQVEALCTEAGDRPVVFLNPRMEDIATIGIGYAGRQLRERFLSTIEPVYLLKPLEGAALRRAYPGQWEVWVEPETAADDYRLVAQSEQKPVGEVLDELLGRAATPEGQAAIKPSSQGFIAQLQGFLKALSR